MKPMTILVFFTFLLGCSSVPVNVKHYLLNTPNVGLAMQKNQRLPIVVLKPINIADYLHQSSLVMLLDQHELYYAPQDVWAEALQSSFYQALLQDLNSSSAYNYVASHSPIANKANTSITIDLYHFHTTHLSSVVASGDFWISTSKHKLNEKNEVLITEHPFYYELTLQQDGFAHAVTQLRQTVAKLAEQINQEIAALPNQ